MFNKLLSSRITKAHFPIEQAFEGEYVAILDQYSLPTRVIYEVNSKNFENLNNAIKKGKAIVMFPLFGYDLDYSRHPFADSFAQLLEKENLDLSSFKSSSNIKLHLKVAYRPILFRPKKLTMTLEESSNGSQDIRIRLNFSINKGSYATILLREFMKTNPLNY